MLNSSWNKTKESCLSIKETVRLLKDANNQKKLKTIINLIATLDEQVDEALTK